MITVLDMAVLCNPKAKDACFCKNHEMKTIKEDVIWLNEFAT